MHLTALFQAGLILSSTAALVTTVPPRADIIAYTEFGSYVLLFLSLGVSLGGLIVGSAIIYITSGSLTIRWFCEVCVLICVFVNLS